jgi:hypothetical protein
MPYKQLLYTAMYKPIQPQSSELLHNEELQSSTLHPILYTWFNQEWDGWGNFGEKHHLEDLSLGRRIIQECIF